MSSVIFERIIDRVRRLGIKQSISSMGLGYWKNARKVF